MLQLKSPVAPDDETDTDAPPAIRGETEAGWAAIDRFELRDAVADFRAAVIRTRSGVTVRLQPRLANVLRHLAAHAGSVVTKDALLDACWPGVVVTENSLTECVSALRRALGPRNRDLIRTVQRRGYMLVPPEVERVSVAVVPFEAFSDAPGDDMFGRSLAADVITEIARDGSVGVIGRDAAFSARALGRTAQEIARAFRTRYVLEGSVRRLDRRLVVAAHLIDGSNSRTLWAERYVRDDADPDALDDLVGCIVATLLRQLRALNRGPSGGKRRATPTRARHAAVGSEAGVVG
ncbi:MAG TPA: winged helix-turn-helix domain-containing protein [Acidisphaera sp.]|nr:winged helix-turn-helix domain-containing protein [Acidisphaera sp.]